MNDDTFKAGEVPDFDDSDALEAVGGDRELLKEVTATFLEEWPGLIDAIREGGSSADHTTVQRAAHTIKGAMRVFNDREVIELSEQIESNAREQNLQDVDSQVKVLNTALLRLSEQLRTHFM